MTDLPLAGIRVLDLTASWAGPWCTKILGDLGAEVIKIESVQFYDLTRGPSASEDWRAYARRGTDKPYEACDSFLKPNRNKLGCTLNLKDARGRELFLRLVAASDLIVENFATGQMERFDLGYDVLRSVNPRVILISMPALGMHGPDKDYIGYGTTVELLSTLTSLTGYLDGPPMRSGMWFGDPTSGIHAAGATMMALLHRDDTGEGQHVEVCQVEGLSLFMGDAFMETALNGRVYERMGNRDHSMAPHGVFPCAGEDRWVTIAVASDEQWTALCAEMDCPALARDPRFATVLARKQNEDEVEQLVGSWTATVDARDVAARLQARGIAAGPVFTSQDVFEDPHVAARGMLEEVTHPFAGTHLYPNSAWTLDGERLSSRLPAPMLGQHNDYVIQHILGLDDATVEELERDAVVGTAPLGDRWAG